PPPPPPEEEEEETPPPPPAHNVSENASVNMTNATGNLTNATGTPEEHGTAGLCPVSLFILLLLFFSGRYVAMYRNRGFLDS
ncbi:hypothetical protein H0O02_05105, partial [Candidatus Micrarchaeota archaeon]|nr:hypothetical protein [Candidatus Micrarchaeota archaeon]